MGQGTTIHRSLRRTRVAVVATITAGILMSGSGGALALSGPSGSGSAGTAQYPVPNMQAPAVGGRQTRQIVAPQLQPTRQQAVASGAHLPLTGLAAIPIVAAGIAMIAAGSVLRRRAASA
jgi:hypothetical protein